MQRLLQGEVGSGKTVVAIAAMMQAVDQAGRRAAAPTQVLAEQHYASISKWWRFDDADDKTASAIQEILRQPV
ncbi:MAG: DEAD/DEAH box helicase [Bifidobacterium pseudocatenulatum]